MSQDYPRVALIIVNYNGKKYLEPLFDSIGALDYPKDKLETILVDNNSKDGSTEFVKERFTQVRIIESVLNNYSYANNLGIKAARAEFIGLVNNDIVLDKNWLSELIKTMRSDERIGIATGKILFPDGKMQSAGHQELPDFYWADRAFKEDDLGQYDKVSYLPSLSHCCVLYRSQCLRDVGLIDEDFNMYLEDVDMSLRAKDKGWVLVYNPLSKATHIFHGSADEESLNFYCERNRLLLVAKHYPLKLAGALAGRGYFSSIEGRRELLSIMQDIIKKLLKHHSLDLALSLLSQIFESLGRIINLEKHQLIQKLDELSILLLEKGDEIKKLNLDINCRDNQLESLKRDLALIRNSRCYRFIALPISRISKIIKGS